MPALILQTAQQQVSHKHKVYLPKSQKPGHRNKKVNIQQKTTRLVWLVVRF